MSVPFLGSIPMDPKIAEAGDSGRASLGQDSASPMARAMNEIITRLAGHVTGGTYRREEPGGE
jgi:ATP-binding protein involved in chromosome partitioning